MSTHFSRSTRQRILDVSAVLLGRSGIAGVSVRDVCQAAEVSAPTIYHHFGDKRGLLEAVANAGFERYLATKRSRPPSEDPLHDLRLGWDSHVEFGVSNPTLYNLMFGTACTTPRVGNDEARKILLGLILRLAAVERLLMTPEQAVLTIHAAAVGTTLTLISHPETLDLSERVREAVFAVVASQKPVTPQDAAHMLRVQAQALQMTLSASCASTPLTVGDQALLRELLKKLV